MNGELKLRSALGVLTEQWNQPAIGKITFVTPPSRDFDIRLARQSVTFCDSISALFPFFRWDSFHFFITNSREDVDRIIGLEYIHDGYPSARAMRSHDILITGMGSEWYPHGLAQMVATGPGLTPHVIIADGFVGWIGGWNDKSYEDNMRDVAAELRRDDALSFQDLLDGAYTADGTNGKYFPGAVVCDMVFAAAGASGIETLFKAGRGDQDLYRAIETATGLEPAAIQAQWKQRVLAFRE